MARKMCKEEMMTAPRPYREVKRQRSARRRRDKVFSLARALAVRCAEEHSLGLCTVDDVYQELVRHGLSASELGSSAGNIFRHRVWKPMPWLVKGCRPSGRFRLVRIWRLVGEGAPPWVEYPAS